MSELYCQGDKVIQNPRATENLQQVGFAFVRPRKVLRCSSSKGWNISAVVTSREKPYFYDEVLPYE